MGTSSARPGRARRDALATGAQLLRSGACLALDRLRGPRARGVPRRVADVTPDWLERALRPQWPELRVRSLRALGGHSGTTTRERLALSTEGAPDLPPTLFLKLTPEGPAQRLFVHAMRLGEMEARFYREIAPGLDLRIPHAWLARATPDGARFALLLEDLSASGARFVAVGERVEREQAAAVMRELARLHAAFWESPRFASDLAWLRSAENRQRRDLPLERTLSTQMVRRALRRLGGGDPVQRGAARLVCERRDELEAFWAEGARTLVHGDCHVGNLFFEGESVGFLDWQVLARAPGLRDVAYFLCNSLSGELRERHQQELLALYLEELRLRGVAAPDPEQAWIRYRGFALYCWLAAAFTVGAGGLQAEPIARAGLERATRAVASLDSLSLFP